MRSALLIFLIALAVSSAFAADGALELSDLQGKRHRPLAEAEQRPVTLIFISPYCPTANAFLPEINRIAAKYADRVAFYLVQSDPAVTVADAAKQVELYGISATVLLDAGQKLAKRVNATVTPETVVLGASGSPRYQGRINDLYLNRTRKQPEPKIHDLVAALDAILAGRAVPAAVAKAVGCSIPMSE
jgi:thiol-disulfide isomerase/thioredoxin